EPVRSAGQHRHQRVTARSARQETSATTSAPRRWLVTEVWLVFALSLGAAGVRAAIDLLANVATGRSLTSQVALLNGSRAPGRPWLDLFLQLDSLVVGIVPVLLVAHFLTRSGERIQDLGVDRDHAGTDFGRGAVIAAVIGGSGLALYLASRAACLDLTVVPESLPHVWWRIPVLVLSAVQNATLEEVLVVGYAELAGHVSWIPTPSG
ncbi:MAG: hypothetical protein ACTHK4_14160, partial [Mycobacteriales bacterium]